MTVICPHCKEGFHIVWLTGTAADSSEPVYVVEVKR